MGKRPGESGEQQEYPHDQPVDRVRQHSQVDETVHYVPGTPTSLPACRRNSALRAAMNSMEPASAITVTVTKFGTFTAMMFSFTRASRFRAGARIGPIRSYSSSGIVKHC